MQKECKDFGDVVQEHQPLKMLKTVWSVRVPLGRGRHPCGVPSSVGSTGPNGRKGQTRTERREGRSARRERKRRSGPRGGKWMRASLDPLRAREKEDSVDQQTRGVRTPYRGGGTRPEGGGHTPNLISVLQFSKGCLLGSHWVAPYFRASSRAGCGSSLSNPLPPYPLNPAFAPRL